MLIFQLALILYHCWYDAAYQNLLDEMFAVLPPGFLYLFQGKSERKYDRLIVETWTTFHIVCMCSVKYLVDCYY